MSGRDAIATTASVRSSVSEKLASLPDAPGVYLMKNAAGEVFYVGKAKSLRDRVRGYFSGADTRAFVLLLDHLLADLEVVLTHSEKEAFLLENELIKAHQPRFNVKLTDDKRFLCLKLDVRQSYPRLEVVRRFAQDGARYFGPYHSASALRETLRLVNRYFQLRTCSDQVLQSRSKPCLQYQIKRCPAPCVFDLASDGSYGQNVRNVEAFLEGRQTELLGNLNRRMKERAGALEFEAAAHLRDQIDAVRRSLERQRMVTSDFVNRDVVGIYREGPAIELHVMRTRQGRLIDARRYSFADTEVPTADVLADFASRYYQSGQEIPDEILFPEGFEWAESLATVLSERHGRSVRVGVPRRGDKHHLVLLASKNAQQAFVDKQREVGAARSAIERLQRALHLQRPPNRLECFDISHLQGQQIVASMVSFVDGVPRKERYRHYKIRSTTGQDDFQSMYEVVSRRARRGLEDGDLPDLIVIDGGKGQLAAARAALDDHGVDGVDLIGLAKARLQSEAPGLRSLVRDAGQRRRAARRGQPSTENDVETPADAPQATADDAVVPALEAPLPLVAAAIDADPGVLTAPSPAYAIDATFTDTAAADVDSADVPTEVPHSAERVFVFGHKNPIVLRQNSAELFLLTRARDEAHRFAITYHRTLRGKAGTRSILDSIAGVGPKRRRQLLRAFGSVARLRTATEEELAQVVGPKLAAAVLRYLKETPR